MQQKKDLSKAIRVSSFHLKFMKRDKIITENNSTEIIQGYIFSLQN